MYGNWKKAIDCHTTSETQKTKVNKDNKPSGIRIYHRHPEVAGNEMQ